MKAVAHEVLFLTDPQSRDDVASLAWPPNVRIEALDASRPHDNTDFKVIVVDADLTCGSTIELLRQTLKSVDRQIPRHFAVNQGRRIEVVQAQVLGARSIRPRPLSIEDLQAILAEAYGARSSALADEPLAALVTTTHTGSRALGGVFDAIQSGGMLRRSELESASEDIADAIADDGIASWLEAVRAHHQGTFQHCLLVTGVLTSFAQALGMSHSDVSLLTTAGLLHDIGKAMIPIDILEKPGALSQHEFRTIAQHPVIGYDYLLSQGELDGVILDAVRGHHEYLDGSGYPDHLSGSQLGDVTRILTVCDIYGALCERRSYKSAMPPEKALELLENMANAGKLESALVKALRRAVLPA